MGLFTLGSGYSERDIREAARALTGFRVDYNGAVVRTYYDKSEHDNSRKTIFGTRGNHDWRDVLELCIDHPRHASFPVTKLWDFFIPTKISRSTRSRLVRVYRRSGHKIRPVLREILKHPALYRSLGSPDMVKSPVVFVAGTLRACREGVRRDDWVYLLDGMGQLPFDPPSVAGWDSGIAWLSTNSMHVRLDVANAMLEGRRQVTDGDRLRSLAGLMASPLGIRVAAVSAPGDFDTRSDQRNTLATDLPAVSAALSAFQADLESRGVAGRVLTLVWSEFGRRPHDNESGTDHGAGGLAWIQGTRVNSGFQSQYPDLYNFDGDAT